MALLISTTIQIKLANKTPPVTRDEIMQCFVNRSGKLLLDTRDHNLTEPKTRWFISETDHGRKLKIVYIPKDGNIIIKTAYDPNQEELRIYAKHG